MPDIDFDDIYYYIKPTEGQVNDWDMLPEEMKTTYERLGIPEAERKFLAGVTAQYESEVVYHKNREDLAKPKAIIFTDMDTAVREYPDIVKQLLRDGDPARRQQVCGARTRRCGRRFVSLRAARCTRRYAAAGVLPHQLRRTPASSNAP